VITRLERRRSGSAYQRNEADGFFQANKKSELLPMRHYRGFDPSMNEPFVKPEVVGEFLQLDHATVVRYANAGFLPGYRLREWTEETLAVPALGNQAEHAREEAGNRRAAARFWKTKTELLKLSEDLRRPLIPVGVLDGI